VRLFDNRSLACVDKPTTMAALHRVLPHAAKKEVSGVMHLGVASSSAVVAGRVDRFRGPAQASLTFPRRVEVTLGC